MIKEYFDKENMDFTNEPNKNCVKTEELLIEMYEKFEKLDKTQITIDKLPEFNEPAGTIGGWTLNDSVDSFPLENADQNEFPAKIANVPPTIHTMTVSPSNFEKISALKAGEIIHIYCTDNRTCNIVMAYIESQVDLNSFPKYEGEQCVNNEKPIYKHDSKKCRKPKTKKKDGTREKMIRSGIITPAKNDYHKKDYHSKKYGNKRSCHITTERLKSYD